MTLSLFLTFSLPAAAHAATKRIYASSAPQGDLTVTMRAGETRDVTLEFPNAGRYAWKGGGKHYASLYAAAPYGRKSAFRGPEWMSAGHVARINEASVPPGKSATVDFTLKAPARAGAFTETFQLAVENAAWVWGSSVHMKIEVLPADAPLPAPSVSAKSWIIADAETGEALGAHDADAVRSIASLTKLMTVMLVEEAGVGHDAVVRTERGDEVGGGRLRVAYGTPITVLNLIASAVVGSANNAANALARSTGLPKEAFVRRMNEKAASLGLARTAFADPTGIEAGNVSTARETAALARKAFEIPIIRELTSSRDYRIATASGGERHILNTNKLALDKEIEVVAGKTGFINEAGYTLATRLRKAGERDMLVVVLGSATKNLSFKEAKTLAEWAWSQP